MQLLRLSYALNNKTIAAGMNSLHKAAADQIGAGELGILDAQESQCRLELVGGGCRTVLGTTAASIPHPARAPSCGLG